MWFMQDVQIVRIDQRVFRGLAKEIIRMIDDVLIQRAGGGHHDQQRVACPVARRGPACCQVLAMVPG